MLDQALRSGVGEAWNRQTGLYTGRMLRGVFSSMRFFWIAVKGSRLRPWRSDYIRWRVETYSGQKAETVRLRDCVRLVFRERRQFGRFVRWLGAMQKLTQGHRVD